MYLSNTGSRRGANRYVERVANVLQTEAVGTFSGSHGIVCACMPVCRLVGNSGGLHSSRLISFRSDAISWFPVGMSGPGPRFPALFIWASTQAAPITCSLGAGVLHAASFGRGAAYCRLDQDVPAGEHTGGCALLLGIE